MESTFPARAAELCQELGAALRHRRHHNKPPLFSSSLGLSRLLLTNQKNGLCFHPSEE